MLKNNIFKLLMVGFLTLTITSCGEEKADKLEDQLEERSEQLDDKSDRLDDASDDIEDATDDIEDAMEDLEDALEEINNPKEREEIRKRINKMIDDLNTKQIG